MSPQEAFKVIEKEYPLCKVRTCLDFGRFYLFSIAPMHVSENDKYYTGTAFDAVDKKTGSHFIYDITTNLAAYEKAKELAVDTIWDTRMVDISN